MCELPSSKRLELMSLSICHTGTQRNPAAFSVSLPHLAVFWNNKARCQEARTRTGSQGSGRKYGVLGMIPGWGKVAHCSSAMWHMAMPCQKLEAMAEFGSYHFTISQQSNLWWLVLIRSSSKMFRNGSVSPIISGSSLPSRSEQLCTSCSR